MLFSVVCGNNFSRDDCRFFAAFSFFCCRSFPFVVINVSRALFNLNINHGERGARLPLPAGVTGYGCNVQRWVGSSDNMMKNLSQVFSKRRSRQKWCSHGACCLIRALQYPFFKHIRHRTYVVLESHRNVSVDRSSTNFLQCRKTLETPAGNCWSYLLLYPPHADTIE